MIGSGGDKCSEADHGIGIGADPKLKNGGKKHSDFGDKVDGSRTKDYYLNLWVRWSFNCLFRVNPTAVADICL